MTSVAGVCPRPGPLSRRGQGLRAGAPRGGRARSVSQRDSSGTEACVPWGRSGGWEGHGGLQPHPRAGGGLRAVPGDPGHTPDQPAIRALSSQAARARIVCAPGRWRSPGGFLLCTSFSWRLCLEATSPRCTSSEAPERPPHTWAPRHQPQAQSPRGTAWALQVAFAPLSPPLAGWGWPSSARPAACRHLPGRSSGRPGAAPGGSHLCSWPVAWTQGRSPVRRPATPWGHPVSPTRGVVGACGLRLSASSSANAGARWPGVVPGVPRPGGPASPRGGTSCLTSPVTQRPPLAAAFPSQAGNRL